MDEVNLEEVDGKDGASVEDSVGAEANAKNLKVFSLIGDLYRGAFLRCRIRDGERST